MPSRIDLRLGDCLEIMKEIPDGSVDMVLTDIPYGEVNRKSNGLRNLDKGIADICEFNVDAAMVDALRICSGSLYIFCGTEQVSRIRATFVRAGLTTRLCIWEKTNPSPMNGEHVWLSGIECCVYGKKAGAAFNERCANTVFRYPTVRGKLHPTQKPLALMERLISASSNSGDKILDFCMGSGTTGVACVRSGRNFIGIEKDVTYFGKAKERIEEEQQRNTFYDNNDGK